MKIVVEPRIARKQLLEALSGVQGAELILCENADEIERALPDADALIISGHSYTDRVDRLLRTTATRLRFIQLLTAGYESLEAVGVRPEVTVSNAGESWSPAVGEHAVALMLALVKCIPQALQAQAARRWDRSFSAGMSTLRGRTLVIVGFGSIGHEVAIRAKGLGMRIIGVSRSARPDALADEVRSVDDLLDVLPLADVVLLSTPSTPSTRGIIGREALARCKPSAILINVGRGELVDSLALNDALRSGRLRGAGLDAIEPEPLPADSPLWDAPDLIITPHVSGACGDEGWERLAGFVAGNVQRFVHGLQPQYVIDVQRA